MASLRDSQHLKLPLSIIESATKNFETCIGKGGYGKVYKGELSIFGKATTIAVKRLYEEHGQGLKEFLTEIQLLSGQTHRNLISLLGYCDEEKEKIIVYEYAARGSLDTYLRSNTGNDDNRHLTWQKRLEICVDVARGLNHLHNHVGNDEIIIHRDIKSSNILIDDDWVAKISDFGLSKLSLIRLGGSIIISNVCGTIGYCDPLYLKTGTLTKESDIYSFGIVLFEVFCGRLCYDKDKDNGFRLLGPSFKDYYERRNLEVIIDPSLREHIGSDSMNKFVAIAYRCLLDDRQQRPSMDLVLKELEESLTIQLSSTQADGKQLVLLNIAQEENSEKILSNNVESQSSQSHALESARRLIRCEKVWRIFQHFDVNKDGGLNEKEFSDMMVATNPQSSFSLFDLWLKYHTYFYWYKKYTDKEKGLSFDGLLLSYDEGHSSVDYDFNLLGLGLKCQSTLTTPERREKVRSIFQHFDLNKDGGLNKEEVSKWIVATNPHKTFRDSELQNKYSKICSRWYNKFIDKEKGITFDGLLWSYIEGHDGDVDKDFTVLGLELKAQDNNEETSSIRDRNTIEEIRDEDAEFEKQLVKLKPQINNKVTLRKRARFLNWIRDKLEDFDL